METSEPYVSSQHIVDEDFIISSGRNWEITVKIFGSATNLTHFCCFDPRFWLEKNLLGIMILKHPLIVDFRLKMIILWTIEKNSGNNQVLF